MPQGTHYQIARDSIRAMTDDQVLFVLGFMPALRSVAYVPTGYVPHPDTVNFGLAWSIRSDHHNLRFVFLFGHPEPETLVVFTPDDWMQAVAKSRLATGQPPALTDHNAYHLLTSHRSEIDRLADEGVLAELRRLDDEAEHDRLMDLYERKVEADEIASLANPDGLGKMDLDDYRARMGLPPVDGQDGDL